MSNLKRALAVAALPIFILGVRPAEAIMGGPVMPEYVQFEPADAPDVVNLNTGDFSYTLPVGEVTGPYGNFPISMSYHAGVGPGQEATWVGLGWTLNPGSINRTLRGTPDDQFQGGDLAFIYAYSVTKGFSVSWSLSYGGIGLDMSYNSFSGYGMNASVSANFYGIEAGVSFGTSGVGLQGGYGYNGVGINGNIGLHDGGISGGVTVGYSTPGGVTIGASVGVSYEYGGRVASNVGFSAGYKTPDGTTIGFSTSSSGNTSFSLSKAGVGASVNLSSHGYSVGVSVGGTGLAVSAASSSSSHSSSNTASITVPGLFSYSRSVYESWVRQASSEHSYGYMYQAGPALIVDGGPEEANSSIGTGTAQTDWDWKFKGRSMDHVGDPVSGHLKPGYDVFNVASQGVSGAFRPFGLTNHRMLMSAEPLGTSDNMPNTLFYLLDEPTNVPVASRRQYSEEFLLDNNGNPIDYSRYAYDYCWDKNGSDPFNVGYNAGDDSTARATKLDAVKSGDCSRYAYFKSTHLNEGNKLLYSRNPEFNLDLKKNFRSRMVFAFMGENGGYFQGEEPLGSGSAKLGRDGLPSGLMKKNIKDWQEWDGVRDTPTWDYPVFGARRIDPILEDDSNIGRLKGFRITNPDGTQYYFTQPVHSIMSASYTTNQAKGGPGFIDRADPGSKEDWTDLLEDMWNAFTDDPGGAIANVGRWAVKLVTGGVSSFLFYSPAFTDKCDDPEHTETLNYSYSMSTNPYATQWLLTEIRGPDFVEFNNSDMSANFGYQVKFKYTEPVPYAWRAPFAPPGMSNDEVPNLRLPRSAQTPEDCNPDVFHASFGVKELVYLKSVETASHRADFVLNDPVNEPRSDGKGWIFRWKGKKSAVPPAPVSPGLPILVGTHFPIKHAPKPSQPIEEEAFVYKKNQSGYYKFFGMMKWDTQAISYRIDSLYLDVQPTPEQIRHMLDSQIVVTGFSQIQTNTLLKGKADYEYRITDTPPLSDGSGDPGAMLHDVEVRAGFDLAPLPASGGVNPNLLDRGRGFKVQVQDIRRATGKELEMGAYKVIFKVANVTGSGTWRTNFNLFDKNDVPIDIWSTVSNYSRDPDDLIPSNVPEGDLKLTSGGGDFKSKSMQPLLTYTGFVDFNDWRGSLAQSDSAFPNEMRYLKRVDFTDKEEPAKPFRRFVFDYDYSIHPQTLNSYSLLPPPSGPGADQSRLAQHLESYPESPEGEDLGTGGVAEKALTGKLKLKSVREVACGGTNCADSLSLPPFRFTYWFEEQTSFAAGETRDQSIQLSTDVLDEWGYWNKHTSEGNEKAHQYFADYGGMAWSLRQIIDPSGGVMEVNYERDRFRGESYAEDELAVPIGWEACPSNPAKVCFNFVPRKWFTYCDRKDRLKGEWRFVTGASGQSYQYMKDLGFVQDTKMFFNVQQTGVTTVGCGLNLGFWKSSGCERHRSISIVGSAKITGIASVGQTTGYFDFDAYDKDGQPPPVFMAKPENRSAFECSRSMNCCDAGAGDPPGWNKRNKYWYCGIDVTRITTDLDVSELDGQFQHTLDKLKSRNWSMDGERFGVVWSRQPSKVLKGGDLRVKELVKRDIGMTQRTRYEYEPGEAAQYPDSVFSSSYAARFSTGKITGVLGDDLPNKDENQKKLFRQAYRDLPAKSRIYGIDDDNADLLPAASITYPKVTMYNVVLNDLGKEEIANGRTVYEFCGPEQRGSFSYKVKLEAPLVAPEDHMRDVYVQFKNSNGDPLFTTQRLSVQTDPDGGHYYEGNLVEYNPFGIKDIRQVKFFYGDPGLSVSKTFTGINPSGFDFVAITFNGVLVSAADLGPLALDGEPVYAKKYFQNDIMKITAGPGGEVVLEDRSSRIGKSKTTTFYRTLKGNGGKEVLVKRDSMVYKDAAPGVDDRFLGSGAGGADKNKVGVQEEQWSYLREKKCGTHCEDGGVKEAWEPFKKTRFIDTVVNVIHRRYPTFLTETWSITGFNGSRQPSDLQNPTVTDFIVTHLTNHRFDPILGKPTFSVAFSGRLSNSPSKATRLTPAYVVDPSQATTDLPNLLFVRNVMETQFREDVFTWDKATTTNNDPGESGLDFNTVNLGGANQANGGALANRLTAVKIMPMTQTLYNHGNAVDIRNPLVSWGSFQPRFNLQTSSNLMSDNAALLRPQPDIYTWSGVDILKVNRFLKTTELIDANGVYLSSRFDPRGFHEIGLFSPARYTETAVLTAEGRKGRMGPAQDPDGWEFFGPTSPSLDGETVRLSGGFMVRHRIDPRQGNGPGTVMYAVEMQLVSEQPISMSAGFVSLSGTISGEQSFSLPRGMQTKRILIDSYAANGLPAPGDNRFFLKNLNSLGTVRIKYLRVYPDVSQAKTFVYDTRGKLIQSVDEANLSTYYEYDLIGNLIAIKDDNGIAYSSQKREMTNR